MTPSRLNWHINFHNIIRDLFTVDYSWRWTTPGGGLLLAPGLLLVVDYSWRWPGTTPGPGLLLAPGLLWPVTPE